MHLLLKFMAHTHFAKSDGSGQMVMFGVKCERTVSVMYVQCLRTIQLQKALRKVFGPNNF